MRGWPDGKIDCSKKVTPGMSQQTKYALKFPKGNLPPLKISIQTSKESKTGFKSTYKGREIRMVKILAKDDAKPNSVSDIEEIVPWTQTVQAYPWTDDESGEEKLLILDDKTKCKMFEKSEFMGGIGFIDRDEIAPNRFSGDHYFVKPQTDSKTKKAADSDVQIYSLKFYLLNENNKMFMTKFVSGDREKYAVMYANGDGIMMSILIHDNYVRTAPSVSRIPLPKAKERADKMLAAFSLRRFDPAITVDRFEDNIQKYIDQLKLVAKGGKLPLRPKLKSMISVAGADFFDALDAL